MFIKCLVIFALSYSLMAHPVIWSGGRVLTLMSSDQMNEFKAHYSVHHRLSLGVHAISFDSSSMIMAQTNALLGRWNAEGAQANLYLFSGLGVAQSGSSEGLGAHFGFQADWETRRWYLQASVDGYFQDNPIHMMRSRVGFAPYLGAYNDVHTWLMLQTTVMNASGQSSFSYLPLVRFFKNNVLIELGSNFSSRYLITAMVHF